MWWEGRWLMQDFSRGWTKGGWKIFKFNSSFMRIRHSWSNLNIWRFNGKRPIKKVTEFAHFWVKHEHTKKLWSVACQNSVGCTVNFFCCINNLWLIENFVQKILWLSQTINIMQNFYIDKIFAKDVDAKIRIYFLLADNLMFFQYCSIQC